MKACWSRDFSIAVWTQRLLSSTVHLPSWKSIRMYPWNPVVFTTSSCRQPAVAAFLKPGLISIFLQSSKRIRSELQFAPTPWLDKMVRKTQKVQELVKIQTPDFSYLDLMQVLWTCFQPYKYFVSIYNSPNLFLVLVK